MQMRDEHPPQVLEADPGIRQARAERLFRFDGVKSGIDEAPAVRSFDEIGVDDRKTADREGDRDAPDSRRDEIAQRALRPHEVTLGTMEASGPFV